MKLLELLYLSVVQLKSLEFPNQQSILQLELMVVNFQANAKLDEPSSQQLLVLLFPVDQPQEKDHSHHPGGAGQQDKLLSWIQYIDEYSPPKECITIFVIYLFIILKDNTLLHFCADEYVGSGKERANQISHSLPETT